MEPRRPINDDFEELIAELHERILSSDSEIVLSEDETADEELRATVECLNLLERVCRQEELQTFLNHRKTSTSPPDTPLPEDFADYEIKCELGRGGSGSVWLAKDKKLGRLVALKIPHPHFLVHDKLRQRFILEASATARLDHPHIVKILEFGNEGPITYFVSEYCNGPNLKEWQAGQEGKIAPRVAATIVRDLALAVDHAHANAVIHRDIKPSNVLVANERDKTGAAVPFVKLCDFSLAKLLEGDGQQTGTGELLGTSAYMSPEQAIGRNSEIDVRTDVYSLGVLLFELLIGNPPFEGETRQSTLYQVIHDEAPNVRRIRKDVPLDLAVIVARCLAKSKQERFHSARELADELDRFLTGVPIVSRPASWWERLSKWAYRRPAAAIASGLAILFPLVVLGITLGALAILIEKNREILQRLYVADMRSAKQAIDDYRLDEARALLAKYEPAIGTSDVRTLPWYLLMVRMRENQVSEWKCHDGDIFSVDVSPNGKLLATASSDGTASLWDYPSGKLVRRLVGHQRDVNQAIFSPNGELLATSGDDGTLRLWEVATGVCRWTVQAHSDEAGCLAFHPDGSTLISGGRDHRVVTWRVQDGQKIGEPLDLHHTISEIAFSGDGSSFFVATHEPRVTRFQSNSMKREAPATEVTDFPGKIRTLEIDPQIERILIGGWGGEIRESDLNGKAIHVTSNNAGVTSIRVLPNGDSFVVTRENGRVEIRERESDESAVPLYACRSRIWDSRIIGSQKVVVASADGYLRIVSLPNHGEGKFRTLAKISGDVERLLITRNGSTLFAAGHNTLAIIDAKTGRLVHSRTDFPSNIYGLALSPDETLIATGEQSGRVCLWNAETLSLREERVDLVASTDSANRDVEAICFLRNEDALLLGTGDKLVYWNRGTNAPSWQMQLELKQINSIIQTSDDRFVVGCENGLIGLKQNGNAFDEVFRNQSFQPRGPICAKTDHEDMYVGDLEGGLHRIRQGNGSTIYSRFTPGRRSGVCGLSLSPSGKYLALGSKGGDGKLCLVDTDQISALSTTIFRNTRVRSTAFSPDEKTMFAGLSDGRIIAKDCDSFDNDTFVFPTSPMKTVKTSPDGSLAIVVDEEDWLKLYQTSPLKRVPSWIAKDFEEGSFSLDGSEIILAHKDRIHRAFIATLEDAPTLVRTLAVKIKEIDHLAHDRVVIRDENDTIRIVELREKGIDSVRWRPQGCAIDRMTLSSKGKMLALGTTDQKITLIDLARSTEYSVDSPGFVRSLAFGPDDRLIAMGDEHGSIHFLDLATKQWVKAIHYPDNVTVRGLAFTDAGKTMLSASSKGGLQLWNYQTGEIIYELDTDVTFEDIAIVPTNGEILACGRGSREMSILKKYQGSRAGN